MVCVCSEKYSRNFDKQKNIVSWKQLKIDECQILEGTKVFEYVACRVHFVFQILDGVCN